MRSGPQLEAVDVGIAVRHIYNFQRGHASSRLQRSVKLKAVIAVVRNNVYNFSNHPEPSVELDAFAALVRNNVYYFNVGILATTQNGLSSWKLLLPLFATASLISVWAC
jgi:hypothetical protein